MSKHRPSPSKTEGREQHFEGLLEAMGFGESTDPFRRYALIQDLEQIERAYARGIAARKQPNRKLVLRYRAVITRLLKLSDDIGTDFFTNDIEKAGWSRLNPDADESTLHMLMEEHSDKRDNVIRVLTARGLDVDHWLKTSGDTYKKRILRKLVVEPFLQLMAKYEITTSRKQRPRKQIFDALFDWLGVERRFRPTSAGINTIARNLEGSANTLNSNAKRQTKK